ncbi:MAG: hypothetical protein ACRD24_11365 [Terriglobales bacterium]
MTDQPSKAAPPPPDAGHIPMTEEMDSARWTLPPVLPVLAAAAVIAVVVVLYVGRPSKPQTTGSITRVVAAEQPAAPGPTKKPKAAMATPVPERSVMVVVHLRLENPADKPLYVRNVGARLEVPGGKIEEDEAASAVDHDRYLQAYPDLQAHKIAALPAETKIAPGAQQDGMVMFAFPVSRESFDQRKSLTVTVGLYDRKPLVLQEKK